MIDRSFLDQYGRLTNDFFMQPEFAHLREIDPTPDRWLWGFDHFGEPLDTFLPFVVPIGFAAQRKIPLSWMAENIVGAWRSGFPGNELSIPSMMFELEEDAVVYRLKFSKS